MRVNQIISELELPKQQWVIDLSNADKQEVGDELVNLVQHAYSSTPQGSFVNSLHDVIPSDWNIIDFDEDPDVDACIFYRGPRAGERWKGHKVQGIGHDGSRASKDHAISKLHALLLTPGYWIESSDAMRHILKKAAAPVITDVKFLQALFNDPHLRMIDHDTYERKIGHGTIRETVFGSPTL